MEITIDGVTLITPQQLYNLLNKGISEERIGINTVYALVHRRDFPSMKVGKKYYIIQEKVGEWLIEQTRKKKC